MSIITFNFNNKTIRTVFDSDGNAWFSVEDIATVLGYKNITEMKRNIDSLDRAAFGIPTINSKGVMQERKMSAMDEFGLYSAISNSEKLEVINFKSWIKAEVLPVIRKAWAYSVKY